VAIAPRKNAAEDGVPTFVPERPEVDDERHEQDLRHEVHAPSAHLRPRVVEVSEAEIEADDEDDAIVARHHLRDAQDEGIKNGPGQTGEQVHHASASTK